MKIKSLDEQLKWLDEKYANEKAAILNTHTILNSGLGMLLEGYSAPTVHHYKLYGRVGSISVAWNNYFSLQDRAKQPDASLLRALLETYKPEEMILYNDGCKSFRPASGVSQEDLDGPKTSDVYPVIAKVEFLHDRLVELHWNSLLNGDIWEFQFKIPLHYLDLGKLDARPRYYGGNSGKVSSWEVCQFYPHDKTAKVIRWASGGREYPNSFTVYWEDTSAELDFPSMIKEVKG